MKLFFKLYYFREGGAFFKHCQNAQDASRLYPLWDPVKKLINNNCKKIWVDIFYQSVIDCYLYFLTTYQVQNLCFLKDHFYFFFVKKAITKKSKILPFQRSHALKNKNH